MKHSFFGYTIPHKLIGELELKISKLFTETDLKYFKIAQALQVELIDFKNTDFAPFLDLRQAKNLSLYNKMRALQICVQYLSQVNPQLALLKRELIPYRSSVENSGQGFDGARSGLGSSTTEKLIGKTFNWIELNGRAALVPAPSETVNTKAAKANPLQALAASCSDIEEDFAKDEVFTPRQA